MFSFKFTVSVILVVLCLSFGSGISFSTISNSSNQSSINSTFIPSNNTFRIPFIGVDNNSNNSEPLQNQLFNETSKNVSNMSNFPISKATNNGRPYNEQKYSIFMVSVRDYHEYGKLDLNDLIKEIETNIELGSMSSLRNAARGMSDSIKLMLDELALYHSALDILKFLPISHRIELLNRFEPDTNSFTKDILVIGELRNKIEHDDTILPKKDSLFQL